MSYHVKRVRIADHSQRAGLWGDDQTGAVRYSRAYASRQQAEREAAAWNSPPAPGCSVDWVATVEPGRPPR